MGSKSRDQGSLLLLPIMIPLTFSVSISFYNSPLKSAENSYTLILYLQFQERLLTQSVWTRYQYAYIYSICSLKFSICGNSLGLTKCTNFTRYNHFWAPFSDVDIDDTSPLLSLMVQAALSRWRATVQSLPPLKLKAMSSLSILCIKIRIPCLPVFL